MTRPAVPARARDYVKRFYPNAGLTHCHNPNATVITSWYVRDGSAGVFLSGHWQNPTAAWRDAMLRIMRERRRRKPQ